MAKTKGPLFSLDAHGSLSKLLTYSKKRTGSQVRKYNKPLTPATASQATQRRRTEFLVAQWQNMSDADKATWTANAKTKNVNLPGYQYFLSEAQKDLYTHHGLVCYLSMNEIINGQVKDTSGQGLHADLEPDYPSDAPILSSTIKRKFYNALRFDGVNNHATIGQDARLMFGQENFSVSFRLKPLTLSGNVSLLSRIITPPITSGWSFRLYSDNHLSFSVGSGGGSMQAGPYHVTLNQWIEVVAKKVGDTVYLYVEGRLADETTDQNFSLNQDVELTIGSDRNHGEAANAEIDELCIYNRALSAGEIQTRYRFTL